MKITIDFGHDLGAILVVLGLIVLGGFAWNLGSGVAQAIFQRQRR